MLKRFGMYILEYLRINAVRRMLKIVDVRSTEVAGLVALAAIFAVFEGVGLTLLLPILQYAESGSTAITESSAGIWRVIGAAMDWLHLPVTLPVLLIMAFVPILMRQVVFYMNTWYAAVVSGRIGVRMRMRTLDAIMGADPEFFTRHSVGELTGVVITQTVAAGLAVVWVIKELSIVLLIAIYVALMLAISVPLTLATAGFGIAIALVIKVNITRIRVLGIEYARIQQEMSAKIVERLGLMRLVKLRDQVRAESALIRDHSESMRVNSIRQALLGARVEVTSDPLLMLSVFVTLYIGISVLNMTLAQLGLLLFVINRLNAKFKEFNMALGIISTNVSGVMLVQEMTADAYASDTIHGGTRDFDGLSEAIALNNVAFEYPGTSDDDDGLPTPVLRDVSITMPAGSFTAVVGRSGAGKSTLVELLPRLREASSGTITFDGVDIREFRVGSLRRGIGYLTQDAMLFNDTVRANLTYGLGFEPTDEQLRAALGQAYATFVLDLPSGLETRLGDRGVRFSGGEQQRLALARVLLANEPILILDEPTSALDSESEAFIQRALADLHGTKTIIVIAHRLATVIQADQLLVVDDGRIVERGKHAELVAANGPYRRLFESQLLGGAAGDQHTSSEELL